MPYKQTAEFRTGTPKSRDVKVSGMKRDELERAAKTGRDGDPRYGKQIFPSEKVPKK